MSDCDEKNQEQSKSFIDNQEAELEFILLQETATNRFSNLRLQPSNKRHSTEPAATIQPKPKKPNNNHSLLPAPTPAVSRCVSDPYNLPTATDAESPQSPPQNAVLVNPDTPISTGASASKKPPRPPILRRSLSDLTPSPAKRMTDFNSPHNKRSLVAMWDLMREMTRWWIQNLNLPVEEDGGANNNDTADDYNSNATVENMEADMEEAVTVEKLDECLIIHFKCPCTKSYQILLAGKNCFYKLM